MRYLRASRSSARCSMVKKRISHLLTISIAAHTALSGSKITTSLYALHLHVSEAAVGVLTALFAFFPMFFAVAAGRIIDRIGIETPLLGGACLMAVGCTLALYGRGSLWSLYIAAVAMGSGFMVIHVATQNAVGAHSPTSQRIENFSNLAMGYSIAGLVGPVVAGFVIRNADHRMSFAVSLGLIGFAAGLAGVRYRCHRGAMPRDRTAAAFRSTTAPNLLYHLDMRHVYGAGLLIGAAQEVFLFAVPLQGIRLGMPASTIGLLLGGFAGGTLMIRFAMRWISARCSEWGILTCALALVAGCYGVLPFLQTPLTILPVALLLGLGLGSCQPNVLALLHHHSPAGRTAEAVGLRATLGYGSQVVLPLVLGVSSASVGPFVIFWGIGAVVAISIPASYRRARRASIAQLEM